MGGEHEVRGITMQRLDFCERVRNFFHRRFDVEGMIEIRADLVNLRRGLAHDGSRGGDIFKIPPNSSSRSCRPK